MTSGTKTSRARRGIDPVYRNEAGMRLRNELGLLTEDDLCAVAGIQPSTAQTWRAARYGPDYVKIGGRVLYLRSDVVKWMELNRVLCLRAH